MKITMRATYSEYEWPEEGDADYGGGNNEPRTTDGYADIHNPWGGFDAEVPEGLVGDAFVAWREENVKALVFDDADPGTLDDGEWDDAPAGEQTWRNYTAFEMAAQFIEDFEGGVWDLWESEPQQDFRTGVYREVTLHVEVAPDPFTKLLVAGMSTSFFSSLLDPLPRLFAEAERLRAAKDAHLRALAERH